MHQSLVPCPERGTPPSSLTRSLHLKRPRQSGSSQFPFSKVGPCHLVPLIIGLRGMYHMVQLHSQESFLGRWLIDWWIDWLIDRLIDWLVAWLIDWLIPICAHYLLMSPIPITSNYHSHHQQPADASGFGARPLLTPQYFCPRSNLVEVPSDRTWGSTQETCHLKISELHIHI